MFVFQLGRLLLMSHVWSMFALHSHLVFIWASLICILCYELVELIGLSAARPYFPPVSRPWTDWYELDVPLDSRSFLSYEFPFAVIDTTAIEPAVYI